MVTDLSGKGTAGTGKTMRPLTILGEVGGGEEVVLEQGARMTVAYVKGAGEFQMTGPARMSMDATGPAVKAGAPAVRRASPIAAEAIKLEGANASVIQAAVRMRDIPAAGVAVRSPDGKLLEPPARYEWKTLEKDQTFAFEIIDGATGKTMVEADVKGGEFAPPAALQFLVDKTYTWSIEYDTGRGGRQTVTAQFTLAGDAERDYFRKLRPAADASFSDRLMYASLMEQAGFTSEAAGLWRVLAAERPESAELRAKAPQ